MTAAARTGWRGQLALWLIAGFLYAGSAGLLPAPASALTAEEQLADPVLEDRARALSKQLRCLVCQNQSIDDSDAELAKDLRREVRTRLQTGASDAEILRSIQETYGDYVLLKPPVSTQTWLLWLAPVLVLLGGAVVMGFGLRRTGPAEAEQQAAHKAADTATVQPQQAGLPIGYIIGAGAVVLTLAGGLYALYGRPYLPDQPLVKRAAELAEKQADAAAQNAELDAAFTAAQQAATEQPDNLDAWLQLALTAARRGDAQTEIKALTAALELTDGAPEIKAMIAEAMSRDAGGQVTVPARQLIDEILNESPDEPRALFLSGLAAYQDEAFQLAIDRWMYLYTLSAANAPWLATLEENIARAAQEGNLVLPDFAATRADSPQTEIADLPQDQQQQMIEQMVDGLAARLKAEPDDREGWLRLARSYEVLGRVPDQIDALFAAAALDLSDDQLVIYLAEVILQSGQSEPYAEQIGKLLDQLEPAAKTRPQWQFFRGHYAMSEGQIELARASWAALLDTLPAESELAQLLQQKIAALPD